MKIKVFPVDDSLMVLSTASSLRSLMKDNAISSKKHSDPCQRLLG